MTDKDEQEKQLEEIMREGAFAEADAVLIAAIAYASAYKQYHDAHQEFMKENGWASTYKGSLIHTIEWKDHKVSSLCAAANEAQVILNKAAKVFYSAGGENLTQTIPVKH